MGLNPLRPLALFGLLVCWLPGTGLRVQGQTPPSPTKLAPGLPPLPPAAKSPIDYFRDLLNAKPEERERLLAGKTSEHRKVLENSLRSYEALTSEERELRLRTMDLRYHLTTMLRTAPSNRTDRLKLIPERERPLIEDRLKIWDGLSPEDQKEALENERMIRVVAAVGSSSPQKEIALTGASSNQVRQIEQQLIRWQTLPEARRQQAQKNFSALFELTETEKMKPTTAGLDEDERVLMQKSLDRFQMLSPTQRSQCVRAFEKFAALSPAERRQFLVSAQEWQKMKPEDRDSWRKLVGKVPQLPPLPPGFGLPPMPPMRPVLKPAEVAATNSNSF